MPGSSRDARARSRSPGVSTARKVTHTVSDADAYEAREDIWIACSCAGASFALYMATLFPRVPGGDSGELIAAAYQLGVGHPPGYPLFCIVEKIICSLLYFGERTSVAYRMNVGNAIIAACTTGMIYLTALPCVMDGGAVGKGTGPCCARRGALFAESVRVDILDACRGFCAQQPLGKMPALPHSTVHVHE